MLPDYLAPGLKAVFVGTAAGERSAAKGHYYSGQGNKFWELLWEAGLTGDRILIPDQDARVPAYGIGLTDLVKTRAASTDSKLHSVHYDVPGFLAKIEEYRPFAIACNGKTAASVTARYLGERTPQLGPASFRVGSSLVYVLPSSSGSNNDPARFVPKTSKAAWWREFGDWLRGHHR
jgi:TDG/mug DNA glycosylase family protein